MCTSSQTSSIHKFEVRNIYLKDLGLDYENVLAWVHLLHVKIFRFEPLDWVHAQNICMWTITVEKPFWIHSIQNCSQVFLHLMRWITIKLPLTPINVKVQCFRIPQRILLIHALASDSLHYAISRVMCLNTSILMLPTSWPPVWPGGRNPFTPTLGKYFLPDSTEHIELGGTDYGYGFQQLSQKERRGVRNKLDKKRIKGKYRLAGGFMWAGGMGWSEQARPLYIYHLKKAGLV